MSDDEPKLDDSGGGDEPVKLATGRTRFCKQCKFSCTDSKAFLQHRLVFHSDSEESKISKRTETKVNCSKPLAFVRNHINMSDSLEDKKKTENTTDIENYDDDDDDGRLIIAESDMPTQPTRSGNIQNRNYSCKMCDFTTNSGKNYLSHEKEHHKIDITIYACDLCDYATKYKQKLPRHRKLHFSGMDTELNPSASDNNDTAEESMLVENVPEFMEPEEEEEMYEEKDEEIPVVNDTPVLPSLEVTPKQPRKKRQEVDPAKYVKVVDDTGIKFACSMCGNIYKWRKSLNKHWNEKHFGEEPDRTKPPPALATITLPLASDLPGFSNKVKSHHKFSSKYDAMTSNVSSPSSSFYLESRSQTATPNAAKEVVSDTPVDTSRAIVMPKIIGPFITDSYVPLYPTTSTPSRIQQQSSEVLDLSQKGEDMSIKEESANEGDDEEEKNEVKSQDQPLDFSVKKEPSESFSNSLVLPADYTAATELLALQASFANIDKDNKHVLQCDKCAFVAKTLVDYSSHMTLHLNKRAFKCAECQAHFSGVDDLNEHFSKLHSNKLHEHKEAIQKIPHGLQQTYHLLKMPLDAITNISSQELHTTTNKQLKCNMCEFVAKWPAELQKHAVSHSEERPFICMVCGSTYKWKWDLVKHFEKSHHTLPNPYKRRDHGQLKSFSPPPKANSITALIDAAKAMQDIHTNNSDQQPSKKRRLSDTDIQLTIENNLNNLDNLETCSNHSDSSVCMSAEGMKLDEEALSKLQMSNMQTLSPTQMDAIKQEYEDQNAADKHQAIMSHVRQRLVMGPPKLVKANQLPPKQISSSDVLLPYKCSLCEYRARWPSEITQHMKNHSDEKPYHCPRCTYKSKWKWDVVKHLKRCGGGTVKDVIDTTKLKKPSVGPPNALVLPQGALKETTPQMSSSRSILYVTTSDNVLSHQNSLQSTNVNLVQSLNAPSLEFSQKLMNDSLKFENNLDQSENGMSKQSSPNQPKQPTFRSLVNQGLYHCLECPFIGHSPAELRRHSLLHSEDKPFVCDVCGYCTRWKCDLKKHIRTYNHFSSTQPQSDSELTQPSAAPVSNNHDGSMNSLPSPNPVYVYKCPKCAYVTSKKHMYEIHMKIHGQQIITSTAMTTISSAETGGKFKCNKCAFTANDLSAFLQHKRSHSSQQSPSNTNSQASDPLTNEISMRTFYMKHRRKPVQQFKCSKCPYVCFKKSGLELHSAMHEHRGEDALQCFYCDYNVFSKNLLIQHMRLHPEYNPNDCVEMFNEEDIKANYKKSLEAENTAKVISESKILEKLKQMENLRPKAKLKYNCEWCEAVLPNVAYLYRHSKMAHIGELKNQEMEMAIQVDENGNHAPQILSPESFNKSLSEAMDLSRTTEPLFDQIEQSVPSPNNAEERSSTPTKSRKSANPHKRLRSFQCTKCPFSAPNAVTYLRHMERHGSNCKNTCNLCDYSIDRLNLLYQHMKQVHGISNKLPDGEEFTNDAEYMDDTEVNDANKTNEHEVSYKDVTGVKMTYSEEDMDTDMSDKPVIEIEGETWWRGVAILACTVNGRKNYKCPKCSFISSDAKITANHSEQHEQDLIEDADGNLEDINQDIGKITNASAEAADLSSPKHIPTYGHICPKCPFRGKSKELLQRHLEMHEYNGKYHCKSCDYSVDRMNLLHQHNRVHEVDKNRSASLSPFNKTPDTNLAEEKCIADMKSQDLESDSNEELDEERTDDFEMEYIDEKDTSQISTDGDRINGQIRYKCVHCPYNTFCKSNIIKHRKQHIVKSSFSCPHCNYSANREHLLQQHIRFHMNIQNNDQENHCVSDVGNEMSESKFLQLDLKNGDMSMEGDDYSDSHLIKCSKCPYKAKSASDFNKHIRLHGASFQYKCDYCSYSHAHNNMVLKHRMVHRNEEGFNVTPPAEKLINFHVSSGKQINSGLSQLEGIVDGLGQSSKFECSQCPYKCNSSKVYAIHKQMHGVNKKYICDYCNWSSERINLIFQHRKVHCKEGDFIPHAENLTFLNRQHALNSSVENGLINVEDIHGNWKCNGNAEASGSPDKKKLYVCTLCPFSCNNKNNFAYHKTLHKVSSKYTCNMCSYSVDRFNLLSQHLRLHQSELTETNGCGNNVNTWKCPSCPYQASTEELLDSHKKMHAADKQYPCSYCDFSTDRQHILQMHLRVHENNSPASEELDNKSYTESSPETVPPKLYFTSPGSPEKPADEVKSEYQCERCPFSVSSKDKLKEHELQHNIQKTFVCPYCDYSCAEEFNMLDHVKVHFPGTDVDENILEKIKKQKVNEDDITDMANDNTPSSIDEGGSHELDKGLVDKDTPLERSDNEVENKSRSQGTKVYVCQYCEREFESKSQMLHHEKQHLIGNTSK